MKFRKGTTPQNGIVYFLAAQCGGSIICKIGFTGGNVWERVRQIQACSPLELDLFGYFEGTLKLERSFHETFAPVRLHGEWFHADGKLYDFIWRLSECGGKPTHGSTARLRRPRPRALRQRPQRKKLGRTSSAIRPASRS